MFLTVLSLDQQHDHLGTYYEKTLRKKLSGHIPHLLNQKLGVKPASSVLTHFPNDLIHTEV